MSINKNAKIKIKLFGYDRKTAFKNAKWDLNLQPTRKQRPALEAEIRRAFPDI